MEHKYKWKQDEKGQYFELLKDGVGALYAVDNDGLLVPLVVGPSQAEDILNALNGNIKTEDLLNKISGLETWKRVVARALGVEHTEDMAEAAEFLNKKNKALEAAVRDTLKADREKRALTVYEIERACKALEMERE